MYIVHTYINSPHTWNLLDSWNTTEKNYGLMYIVGTFMAFCFMNQNHSRGFSWLVRWLAILAQKQTNKTKMRRGGSAQQQVASSSSLFLLMLVLGWIL